MYKPPGFTSAEVTNILQGVISRMSSPKVNKRLKIGHGGTLDKGAEGVLVIGVGEDCKQLSSYLHGNKSYTTIGCLGIATTTYDADGAVTDTCSYGHVTEGNLRNVICSFKGEQLQTPPLYSALKFNGRRASDLARKGHPIDMATKKRLVTIHEIELLQFMQPDFKMSVSCSSGTYIRSLVHDIGIICGTGAFVKSLSRTRQGPFTIDEALTKEYWILEHLSKFLCICEKLINY